MLYRSPDVICIKSQKTILRIVKAVKPSSIRKRPMQSRRKPSVSFVYWSALLTDYYYFYSYTVCLFIAF
jgi:hypothetical protein